MTVVRNILAVILGFIVGNVVNAAIIAGGHAIMPPPAGFDGSSMEGVATTIHLLRPVDFIVPFLAHAMGPPVGFFRQCSSPRAGEKLSPSSSAASFSPAVSRRI